MSASQYESYYLQWDERASIRCKKRPTINQEKGIYQNFYPIERQPICKHPKIVQLGQPAVDYVLVQSAFKFMHEIAVVEVDVINQIILNLLSRRIPFDFPQPMRDDLLSVMVDEAYHAMIAHDFIAQVSAATNIIPLKTSRTLQFSIAIEQFKQNVPDELKAFVEIIAICIGESTLTKELFNMRQESEVHPLFRNVIIDHVADEGRHQMLFCELLKYFWSNLPPAAKDQLGPQIPHFLVDYLCPDLHIEFDQLMLAQLPLSPAEIDEIIQDIYQERTMEVLSVRLDPITKNLMKMIEYAGIMDHELSRQTFCALKFAEDLEHV